jgi:predicted glycosyltransferase
MAIARALKNCDVLFVNGGESLSGIDIPSWVTVVNMPPITSDGEFQSLNVSTSQSTLEEVQQARKAQLLDCFDRHRPHVLIIELFPFGRKRFAFELLPLLAHIRLSAGSTKVVCSLRDILVTKSDQVRHEDWVVSLMNRYFDLLLIHSDPTFQTLDETFSRCQDLRCDVRYTGFVTQEPDERVDRPVVEREPTSDGVPLVLVSVGGGRVGYELLDSAVQASSLLMKTHPHRMLVFTGPYMPDQQYEQLQRLAAQQQHIEIRRFTPHFQSLMKRATVSISMAGYNTCMNLLTTGTRALVLPFTGHANEEQTIRAKKLERCGLLTMLKPDDLLPDRLAAKIEMLLTGSHADRRHSINVDGGKQTAIAVEALVSKPHIRSSTTDMGPASNSGSQTESWLSDLHRFLTSQQAQGQDLHLFLRDDDVDEDEETLSHLLDIALARSVPMNLEIVPGRLMANTIAILKNTLRADPSLLSLNQHGWIHANHEIEGRKCEFGPARSLLQQGEDIARGKALLETAFEDRFYPAFTPPWNRCTKDTYQVLDELGFLILSKDRGKEPIAGYRFKDISTTLDLYTWKTGARMKAPHEIVQGLISQMQELPVVGLLLHHKVMDAAAFYFLDQLLRELSRFPVIRFHTFQTLLPLTAEARMVPR